MILEPLHYLVGPPGSGKTTQMLNALSAGTVDHRVKIGLVTGTVWVVNGRRVFVLGAGYETREPFAGTDRLSMAASPAASEWVTAETMEVWGEGDRLANKGFLGAAAKVRPVTVWDLTHPDAHAWSSARAAGLGTDPQTESWWKGRATKTRNLLEALSKTPGITIKQGPFLP